MTGVMDGVRVIEVADYVFVPAAGAILADWGADVIKIEHHEHGDLMRGLKTFHSPKDGSVKAFNPVMEAANRGKRSIGLNLASDEGRAVLADLVKSADVFLTSKLESTRRKLKIDVADIRGHNDQIVYARGSGHGVRGPEADKGSFDALDFWYRSGMGMASKPHGFEHVPAMPAPAFGDNTGAMNVAGGIAAALFHRERTGNGTVVDVSLLASGMWTLGGAIAVSKLYDAPMEQPALDSTVNALVGTYATSDGRWLAFCCLQAAKYFPDLCRVLDRPELAVDDRFASAVGQQENACVLREILVAVFATRTYEDWLSRLDDFEGQWAPVQDALSVVTGDEQVAANDYVAQTISSTGDAFSLTRSPVQFDETPAPVGRPPEFNADGDALLAELGLSEERILELKIANAVA